MRIVTSQMDNMVPSPKSWFYFLTTLTIYHNCIKRKATPFCEYYPEDDSRFVCPDCNETVPDFVLLAANLGVSTA